MKKLLLIFLLVLVSCKSVNVQVKDQNNVDWDISYFVWGKSSLQDVDAKVGDVTFTLGSSQTDTPTGLSPEIGACLFFGVCPKQD